MRALAIGIPLVLALAPMAGAGPADGSSRSWVGQVEMFVGGKWFGEDIWGPTHQEIGFRCDLGPRSAPARLVAGFLVSPRTLETGKPEELAEFLRAQVGDVLGTTTVEMDLGVRVPFRLDRRLHPTLGAGLGLVFARFDYKGYAPEFGPVATALQSDGDTGPGVWVSAGVFWARRSPGWGAGVEARFSAARVEHFGRRLDPGGLHLGATLGRSW